MSAPQQLRGGALRAAPHRGDGASSILLPYTIYEAAFADAIELSDMHVSGKVGRIWRYYQGKPNYVFGDGLSYSQFSLTCAGA
jgi:hypothetical protein